MAIKAYRPADGGGAQVFVEPGGGEVLGRWQGEWLNVVADGAEHVLSFFAPGLTAVHQAVWSGSPYLSWVYHSALAAELVMAEVRALAGGAGANDRLRPVVARLDRFLDTEAAGYQALTRRFGLDAAPARRPSPSRKKKKEVSR